jgi:hypothetical protein
MRLMQGLALAMTVGFGSLLTVDASALTQPTEVVSGAPVRAAGPSDGMADGAPVAPVRTLESTSEAVLVRGNAATPRGEDQSGSDS